MKNFFKKLAVVLALALVVTAVAPAMASQAATTQKLNATSKTLYVGGTFDFNISNKVSGSKYAWTSSDKAVATVGSKGLTTAVAAGTATISVKITFKSGAKKTLSAKVTVQNQIDATAVAIANPKASMTVGETYDYNRTLTPANSTNKTYWIVKNSAGTEVANTKTNVGLAIMSKQGVFKPTTDDTYTIQAVCYRNIADTTARATSTTTSIIVNPSAAVVSSATALSGKQIQIVFSTKVAKTDAETEANYLLNGTPQTGISTATLQDDGKTVILTKDSGSWATSSASATYAFTVNPITTDAYTSLKTAIYTTLLTVADTTAPTVVSASATTNSTSTAKVVVTFSEPVQAASTSTPIAKIDGVTASIASSSDISDDYKTITFTAASALATSKSHTLQIVNLTDFAGNVTTLSTTTFSVTQDTVAPTVTTVTANGDKAMLVTFSKTMNYSTVIAANLQVMDPTYQLITAAPYGAYTVTSYPTANTNSKQFLVTLNSADYTSTVTSRTFYVVSTSNLKDTLGNAAAVSQTACTLTKDSTAPTINGITYQLNTNGTIAKMFVTFSEDVTPFATTTDGIKSKFIFVNSNGVLLNDVLTNTAADSVSVSGKVMTITNNSTVVPKGTVSVQVLAGLANDKSSATLASAAYTGSLVFAASTTTSTFAITSVDDTTSNNKLVVNFGTAVKGGAVAGSATLASAYTLNGAALPDGTTITLDSNQQYATITLGKVTTTDPAAILVVNGVQTTSGALTNAPYVATVHIYDNVAPTLTAAAVQSATDTKMVVRLTYSEAMAALSDTNVATAYAFTLGGATLTPTTVTATRVANYPTMVDVTITLGAANAALTSGTFTVTTLNAVVGDAASNLQTASTTVTATR